MDINSLQTYTHDLLPLNWEEGRFVEYEDGRKEAIFEISYDSSDTANGTLRLKPNVDIDELKKLNKSFLEAVFSISNNNVALDEAANFKSYPGRAFSLSSKDWIVSKPIGLTLEKAIEDGKRETSHSEHPSDTKPSSFQNTFVQEVGDQKIPVTVTVPKEESLELGNLDNVQYVMSGHVGEKFFFEGSDVDKSGASFKIEYDSQTGMGLYDIVVDLNNLRTMDSGFRRGVIKIVNNGTTIKEATGFTVKSKGRVHFSKDDKVWIVDELMVISLIK